MKTKQSTKRKRGRQLRSSELVSLRRIWKERIHELNNGTRWMFNTPDCKKSRADKAEGIQECITELNYLLKHGRAG